ncbi:hypothetical protein [Spiroplasma cantharicola]|uniref:Uncharacterized protein n=1 Tax=Spiroplasma cantharicola TaxID=362837 RepID=A0A0M4KBM9_9MOLU|nr:hypothetical protein [Spiroplasma cantharicola]ALD66015.1 hypothetical protein SCANT_v1c01050 [Spiroplasma cantharicola]
METIKTKVLKTKKPKEFNGFKTLYLINLKRLLRNKAVLATAIISIIVTLILSSSVAGLLNTPINAFEIGVIIVSISFIFEVFFFIVFMIIMSTELIKKQMQDGIQNIETRSGIKFNSSFLLRWFVFITFVGGIALINSILKIIIASSIVLKFDLISGIVLSTCVFYFFLTIVWSPIVFLVTILCSIAWSVMINILIAMILCLSGLFSSLSSMTDFTRINNYDSVMKTNIKINISKSFYDNFKDDKAVNSIFIDSKANEKSSLFLNQIQTNLELESLNAQDINYYNLSNLGQRQGLAFDSLIAALYGGGANIHYAEVEITEPEDTIKSEIAKPVLQDTEIFKILNEIYQTILTGMKSNNNKPTISSPGFKGGYLDELYGAESGFHNLSPLIKWLKKQEDTKKYSALLDWVNSIYSKYAFILTGTKMMEQNRTYIFASDFDELWKLLEKKETVVENSQVHKVYKRYPELLIINNIITEAWLNNMLWKAELYNSVWGLSSEESNFNDAAQAYQAYQGWANESILKNNINIFQHFSIMYSQLFGSAFNKDLVFSKSVLAYSGITNGYTNYSELAKYDLSENKSNEALTPIFEKANLKKKFGYNVAVSYLIYLLVSFGLNYLVYLVWSRKSKI